MPPVVIKKPRAEQDLLDHFVSIGARNPDAAERFLDAAEEAFALSKSCTCSTPSGISRASLRKKRKNRTLSACAGRPFPEVIC
jgi:hypothetical protein